MAPPPPPPGLQEAVKASTAAWQADLSALFINAKDRYPDVVWEFAPDGHQQEEVWGHKAIVYARAPPSFQERYFSFRPAPTSSPLPYSSSPTGTLPGQSSLSLSLDITAFSRSSSPYRDSSPTPSTTFGTPLRIKSPINSVLFYNELEYLYTGKGLGQAFEFLFDTSGSYEEADLEENRIDKLRKDLVFMWRSRLYSDVRIALTGNFSSSNHEDTTAIFSSHRFILISRSPYFLTELSLWNGPTKWNEPRTINLPSPPFTPASLHFTLGFIYTGTLIFSHRTFDLDTAFHIMRSASYLALDTLYNEVQARIVQEMVHGLFHTFLEFSEYERVTGGKWGTGGCRCRQCARRAPRVLEFAMSDDVKNPVLDRGARRALVGLFGEGWCTAEFAGLPQRTKDTILKGLGKRTTPMNIFPLLFALQHALKKLDTIIDAWAGVVRESLLTARRTIDSVLASKAEECFEQREWLDVLESDGIGFEDKDRVNEVMASIKRGLSDKNAASVYQALVSSILLRPRGESTMLAPTSHIRVQVEDTRMEIIRWMRKRWMAIRNESGFDNLDTWALQEISHEIEVPVEDLFNPAASSTVETRKSAKAGMIDNKSDTTSMVSVRPPTLNRSNARRTVDPSRRGGSLAPSVTSAVSKPPSTFSSVSRLDTRSTAESRSQPPTSPRPDSPSRLSTTGTLPLPSGDELDPFDVSSRTSDGVTKLLISRPSNPRPSMGRSTISSRTVSTVSTMDRPKSSASSFLSVRSTASTLRGVSSTTGLRPSSSAVRPTSASSSATDTSTFITAASDTQSTTTRSRRTSAASVVSNASVRVTPPVPPPKILQPRQVSTSSTTSLRNKRPPVTPPTPTKLSPAANSKRPNSTASASTTTSIRTDLTTDSPKRAISRKSLPPEKTSPKPKPDTPPKLPPIPNGNRKSKSKSPAPSRTSKTSSPISSHGTLNGTIKRKTSADTITTKAPGDADASSPREIRGDTLEIGIPCVISSKRKRFMAFARYIGEVEGELGPWVGVEVPVADSWGDDSLEEGRAWNDGSWGGIRYFEIGGFGSGWDFGDDKSASARRRGAVDREGLKREGDSLVMERVKRLRSASPTVSDISNPESRGLFVRPQQVLYVVDAVGSDL